MADEPPIQTPEAQELAPHQADVAEAGQVVAEAPSPLEEARRQLAERQAEVAEAGRVVAEADEALTASRDSVASITAEIENHDGGDGIEILAAKRATQVARGEALAKRLIAKQHTLAEAQELHRQALLAVDEIELASSRQRVAEAERELKELIARSACEADEARVQLLGHFQQAVAAFRRIQSAKGNASSSYATAPPFASGDAIVGEFKRSLDHAEGYRFAVKQQELEQLRAAARKEHLDAKIRSGWTPPEAATNRVVTLSHTPPPVEHDATRTINDLND